MLTVSMQISSRGARSRTCRKQLPQFLLTLAPTTGSRWVLYKYLVLYIHIFIYTYNYVAIYIYSTLLTYRHLHLQLPLHCPKARATQHL